MPWLLHNHHRLLTCTNRCHLRRLLDRALPTHRWKGTPDRGLLLPKKVDSPNLLLSFLVSSMVYACLLRSVIKHEGYILSLALQHTLVRVEDGGSPKILYNYCKIRAFGITFPDILSKVFSSSSLAGCGGGCVRYQKVGEILHGYWLEIKPSTLVFLVRFSFASNGSAGL